MTLEQRDAYYLEVIAPRLGHLGGRICDATGMEDDVLHEVAYQELMTFYDEQVVAGYWHPSFTESIADFTWDDTVALVY